MRILTLCYEYPPLGGGGGRVAQTVARGLAARGHEVRVQTAGLGFRSTREEGDGDGVRVFRTASGRRRAESCSVPEMGTYLATSLLPTLLRHCRGWRPDVLHAHFAMPTGLLAWTLHRLTGIPYVLTAHLGDVPGGVPEQTDRLFRVIGPLARRVWREAGGATAVSGFVQELAERAYARPVRRILNGIDLTGRPALEEVRVAPVPHLLFLGRFNRQKNAPLLIESLGQLLDLPWQLTMIGDGPDFLPVQRMLTANPALAARVELAGWHVAEQVAETLAQCDVLCLPSSSEGLPVAAVEALKYGLAIASTKIPGMRDVLAEGLNGMAAPVQDAAAYAANLRALLSDRARLLAMREASWRKAEDFALPRIIDAYEEVLAQVASPKRV